MTDEPLVIAAIVHDMAGMLSNVAAFAGILEDRPDHPSRDEFLPVMAREARSATQALQDLQLARSLSDEWPASDLGPIEVKGFLNAVAEQLGHPGWLATGISGLPEGAAIIADAGVLNGLLLRSLEVASRRDYSGSAPLLASVSGPDVNIEFDLSGCEYEGDVRTDVERGRRELRAFALLRCVVEKWGGDSQIGGNGDEILLSIRMPLA